MNELLKDERKVGSTVLMGVSGGPWPGAQLPVTTPQNHKRSISDHPGAGPGKDTDEPWHRSTHL